MKYSTTVLATVLGSTAMAFPRSHTFDSALPVFHRMTAFVINEKGDPSIQCWQIGGFGTESEIRRHDGTIGIATQHTLASGDRISGVDVTVLPPHAPILPLPAGTNIEDIRGTGFDFSDVPFIGNVQSGLLRFGFGGLFGSDVGASDDDQQYYFGPDNGDDWFYFEDNCCSNNDLKKTSCPKIRQESPVQVDTLSSGNTEFTRMKFKEQPTHKVLHEGPCNWAGVTEPDSTSGRAERFSKQDL